MRFERIVYGLLIIVCSVLAAINWRRAALFQGDNETLRGRVESLEAEITQSAQTADVLKASAEKVRTQTSDLAKLRNEVTQLRVTAKSAEGLAAENGRLKGELEKLRASAGGAGVQPTAATGAGNDKFPRSSWNFAGYASPEAALVSALWAMREGDPKTYLNSLAPEEQQKAAQNWQNKSEAEVAEKHKSDVSTISGLRVLERQSVSATEMVMDVYLEGPERMEKVRMSQVGQDWKFGGFIGNQPAAAAK